MYITWLTNNDKFLSVIYLMLWIFIGNYVLLNLFLAILLDGTKITKGFGQSSEMLQEDLIDDLYIEPEQAPVIDDKKKSVCIIFLFILSLKIYKNL